MEAPVQRTLLLIVLALWTCTAVRAQDWHVYPYTPAGSLISFPADEGRHPGEPTEWWYMAGHLKGESSGDAYSFMLTYFYYPGDTLGISYDGFRILNLANDDSGVIFTETMPVLNYRDLATDHLHLDAGLINLVDESWVHREEPPGTLVPFEYEISATAAHGGLNLSTVLQKRPLIPGGDGLFDQGTSSYTYYYSLTHNQVSGTIDFDGTSEQVSGSAWIDRQYGSFNPNVGEKYEWFFLQLSNGMDLNIWNLFTADNRLPDQDAFRLLAAYVDENTQYTEHAFTLERLGYSMAAGSGNFYARQWRLQSDLNQLDLVITTLHPDSEVAYPFPFYEGATVASGTVNGSAVTGLGFAELVKRYELPQLILSTPTARWNKSLPIAWTVSDPDQGRPLLFDVEYSTDQGLSWLPVATALADTFCTWNDTPLVHGDSCLFKVTGFTPDHVLEGSYESSMHTLYDDQYTFAQQESVPAFLIYPNPVGHTLKIRWKAQDLQAMEIPYEIIDGLGRTVRSGLLSGDEIDVNRLPGGVYLIILKTGQDPVGQTFLKQ